MVHGALRVCFGREVAGGVVECGDGFFVTGREGVSMGYGLRDGDSFSGLWGRGLEDGCGQ